MSIFSQLNSTHTKQNTHTNTTVNTTLKRDRNTINSHFVSCLCSWNSHNQQQNDWFWASCGFCESISCNRPVIVLSATQLKLHASSKCSTIGVLAPIKARSLNPATMSDNAAVAESNSTFPRFLSESSTQNNTQLRSKIRCGGSHDWKAWDASLDTTLLLLLILTEWLLVFDIPLA